MSAIARPQHDSHFMPMRVDDIDAVLAAEVRIYPFPWTRGNFADSLASGYSAWVCRAGGVAGDLIGYAVLMMVLDEAHLLNLSILPEWQRQGRGGALLEHMFDIATGHGAHRMYLEVRRSNESGRGLYERFGFAVIGHRRAYYPAAVGREDAIVMEKGL